MVQYSPKYASQIIGIMALICLSSFTQQPTKSKSKSFKEIQIIAYAWEIGKKRTTYPQDRHCEEFLYPAFPSQAWHLIAFLAEQHLQPEASS